MKLLFIICLAILTIPNSVSAKSIEKQETREVQFRLAKESQANREIVVRLTNGESVRLNAQNNWQCRKMFFNGVEVENVNCGTVEGSMATGEVQIIVHQKTPSVSEKNNPKFKESKGNRAWLYLVGGVAVLAVVAVILRLRKD